MRLKPSAIYRGWLVIAAAFLSTAFVVGGTQWSFGVFVQPLEAEFGWTRTQINVALSLSAISGLIAPIAGRIMDRIGVRPIMMASLSMLVASFLLRPFMTELWHWYALNALMFAGFAGATSLVAGKLVALWFHRSTGRVLGLTSIGNNFGAFTMPLLAGLLVGVASWEWTYTVFGIIGVSVLTIVFLVVRDSPEHIARAQARSSHVANEPPWDRRDFDRHAGGLRGLTVQQALRSRDFYALALGFLAGMFTFSTVVTQLVPHLENEGFSAGRAVLILSMIPIFGILGKLIIGYLSDRLPVRYILVLCLAVHSLSMTILVMSPASSLIWLFVPVYGLSQAGIGMLAPLMIQRSFGLKSYGSILGLIHMVQMAAFLIGPVMAGAIFDATESYRPTFVVLGAIFMIGALAVTQVRAPSETPPMGQGIRSRPPDEV